MKRFFMMIVVAFMSLAFAAEPKANVKKVVDAYSSGATEKAISLAKADPSFKSDYMSYMVKVIEDTKGVMKNIMEEYGSALKNEGSAEYEKALKTIESKYGYLEKDMAYYESAGELLNPLLEAGVLTYTDLYSLMGPAMEMADLAKSFSM